MIIVVQSFSRTWLFAAPWTASLSFSISQSLLKLMSIESLMPSNHLIRCCPLLLPPSAFSSVRVFSNELALCINSVQFSRSVMSISWQSHGRQHSRPPCPLPTSRVYPNPRPLCWWWHPTILSSVIPFSSCLLSFQASGSFPESCFFASRGQSIGASASIRLPNPLYICTFSFKKLLRSIHLKHCWNWDD